MVDTILTEESDKETWDILESKLAIDETMHMHKPGWVIYGGKHYKVVSLLNGSNGYIGYDDKDLIESESTRS